jgi:RimJ/RimL family protein N-acetyltransferase
LIRELREEDIPFLIELWHNPDVMRYADEFPTLRGWRKSTDPGAAWQAYLARRAELGPSYTQWVLWLGDGAAIGESFFVPLPEGYTFGRWAKPDGVHTLMGDIKLLPAHWGQGLGTEGMRLVVRWAFAHTPCDLLVVPPHRHNPAAERVYEKAGCVLFTGMRSWHNHKIMELTRQRFERQYTP